LQIGRPPTTGGKTATHNFFFQPMAKPLSYEPIIRAQIPARRRVPAPGLCGFVFRSRRAWKRGYSAPALFQDCGWARASLFLDCGIGLGVVGAGPRRAFHGLRQNVRIGAGVHLNKRNERSPCTRKLRPPLATQVLLHSLGRHGRERRTSARNKLRPKCFLPARVWVPTPPFAINDFPPPPAGSPIPMWAVIVPYAEGGPRDWPAGPK